jgi:hypothetical protein
VCGNQVSSVYFLELPPGQAKASARSDRFLPSKTLETENKTKYLSVANATKY